MKRMAEYLPFVSFKTQHNSVFFRQYAIEAVFYNGSIKPISLKHLHLWSNFVTQLSIFFRSPFMLYM